MKPYRAEAPQERPPRMLPGSTSHKHIVEPPSNAITTFPPALGSPMRWDVIHAYSGTPLLGRPGRHNDQLCFESLGNGHEQPVKGLCVLGIAWTGSPSRDSVPAKAHNNTAGLTWYFQVQRLILASRVEDIKFVPAHVEGELAQSSRLGMKPFHILIFSTKQNIELYRVLVEK